MSTTPGVQLLVSVNGGAYLAGTQSALPSQTLAFQAASTGQLTSVIYEITDFPPGFALPAGWSADPTSGYYFYAPANVTTPPPSVTVPTLGPQNWGLFMCRLRGNNNPLQLNADGTPNTSYSPQLTDTSAVISVVSPNLGLTGIAAGLTTQLDVLRAWVGPLMQTIRLLDNLSSGGGPFSAGGDLAGTSISQIVKRINGATVPTAGSLTTGNVLQVSGPAALTYAPLNLSSTASVTSVLGVANGGTGLGSVGANGTVLTVVSGVPVWAAPSGSFTAGGDLGGTSTVQNVLAVHGASVPIAGSLTTGNLLQVTGPNALGYAPLSLAGGTNYITGLLPAANQAPQTLLGDVHGTTAVSSVVAIHGATAPTIGAIGNVLQVATSSGLSYGPLTLSSPASVTGSLGVANGGTGLSAFGSPDQLIGMNHAGTALTYFSVNGTGGGTGDLTLVSGIFTTVALQTIPVSTTAPTSNQVLTYNSGTGKWTPATPGSGASVAGSGVWHSSGSTLDAGAYLSGTSGWILFTNIAKTDTVWAALVGDVQLSTSTLGAVTVTKLQGQPVSSSVPSPGYVLIENAAGSSWAPTQFTGDVTLSAGTPGLATVGGIKNNTVPTLAAGYLQWTGSAFAWTTPANASVTNSGIWHSTSGLLDSAAYVGSAANILITNSGATNTAWVPVTGDAAITAAGAVTVSGLRNNPVANVAPTAGQVLIENALATGSAWTSFSASGDVTLSTSTPGLATVIGVHGASVPAAGSLVTGNSLYVSGTSALSYSALNLAGGSGWITGTLPVGNGGTGLTAAGSNGQALLTISGAPAWTSISQDVALSTTGAATVNGIKANAIPSLTTGFLQWTGSAFAWATPSTISVTNSGVWHSTAGTLDPAAYVGTTGGQFLVTNSGHTDTAWVTLSSAGDVLGSSSTPGKLQVQSINGATVPVAGSLTIGNVLQVAGSATLQYAAVNLAGGANYVTGTLPVGNLPSLSGDVTGALNATVVGAISGSSPINVTPAAFHWAAATTSPGWSQLTASSGANPSSMTFAPQAPNSGSSTTSSGTPGSFIVNIAAPVSTGTEAWLEVERAGSLYAAIGGRATVGATQAALYLGPSISPSGTNPILVALGGTTVYLNAPNTINFAVGMNLQMQLTTGSFSFASGYTTPTLNQTAPTSDVATIGMLVQAQSAYLSASTNKNGANLTLSGGAPATGGTSGSAILQTSAGADAVTASSGTVSFVTTGNFEFGSISMSGTGVIGIKNAGSLPSGTPSGGGYLVANGGAGQWYGSSGTVTTFGPAHPHCPRCAKRMGKKLEDAPDFVFAIFENKKHGKASACILCLKEALRKNGIGPEEYMVDDTVKEAA